MQAGDGILAANRRYFQIVIERVVPDGQLRSGRAGPLQAIDQAQRRVDREGAGDAEVRIERVGVAVVGVDVGGHRAFRPRFAQHIGVAGVQAFDGGAFVSGGERGDEVILQSDEKHVAIKGRPILLGEVQLGPQIAHRRGMLAASGHEVVMIENAVVLVGDQVHDQAEPLGMGHVEQVLRSIVQIAAIVHVDVRRAAPPAWLRERRRTRERQ